MKVKTKISRYIFLKLIKRGILRGGPVWFSMGVLATFLKVISVFEDREKNIFPFSSSPEIT